jgi:predicted AAA+ superfamily ATPase
MLPIVLDAPFPKEVLRAYAGIYLKEEVQAEGIVRNVGDFARFLEAMSFSHASLINTSNVARECQIARKTVDSYLSILEDLLLSFRLDVFRQKAKRALSDHSKFYFFDSGVYVSLRPQNLFDKQTELEGGSLEGLVAQHLHAWKDAQLENTQLHFWRTSSKLEVDFIVSNPDCFLAIEVKNGSTIHPADLRGLEAFRADYPEATPLLLYRGKRKYRERDILCCPVDEFLLTIHPNRSLL